jgi:hypothetical protein
MKLGVSASHGLSAFAGLALGLVFGLGVAGGVFVATRPSAVPAAAFPGSLPEGFKLHAVATHGGETMGMATGMIDEGMEGIFLLDYLTGDLNCYVLNPRNGKWGAKFTYKVATTLEVDKGKKPAYLMCTGGMNLVRGASMKRPGDCLIYVCDANTGKFCVLAVPLWQGAMANNVPQAEQMVLLDVGVARTAEVRD